MNYKPVARATVTHSATIDLLRCIAIFEVVLFHWNTKDYNPALGLPFLTLISYFFVLGKSNLGNFRDLFKVRFSRLIVPWFGWSLFYLALSFARGAIGDSQSFIRDHKLWQILMGGGSIHLWFLPMLFYSSCGLFFVRKLSDSWRLTTGITIGLLGFFISFYLLGDTKPKPWPIHQFLSVIPLFFLGFALVRIRNSKFMDPRGETYNRSLAMLTIVTAIATLLYIFNRVYSFDISIYGGGTHLTRYLFTGCILLLSVQFKLPNHKFLSFLAKRMYGVYLVHCFITVIIKKLFYIADINYNGAFIVFTASVLFTYLLSKNRFTRLFV